MDSCKTEKEEEKTGQVRQTLGLFTTDLNNHFDL